MTTRPAPAGLRRFVRPAAQVGRGAQAGQAGPSGQTGQAGQAGRAAQAAPAAERCDLCGEQLPADHRHLVDLRQRSLRCACTPCHLLFARPSAAQPYRAVPDRYLYDPGYTLDEGDWTRLQIPVALAFFLRNSDLGRLAALYPSPAGATESELDPETWQSVLGRSPLAAVLRPDVEALLVHREDGGSHSCHLVPVDACYELVGRMRLHWQGFDGGAEARADLAAFFDRVRARSRPLRPADREA